MERVLDDLLLSSFVFLVRSAARRQAPRTRQPELLLSSLTFSVHTPLSRGLSRGCSFRGFAVLSRPLCGSVAHVPGFSGSFSSSSQTTTQPTRACCLPRARMPTGMRRRRARGVQRAGSVWWIGGRWLGLGRPCHATWRAPPSSACCRGRARIGRGFGGAAGRGCGGADCQQCVRRRQQ